MINFNSSLPAQPAQGLPVNFASDVAGNVSAYVVLQAPNVTTTQKLAIASPVAGQLVFDTTLNKLCVYVAASSAWQTVTSV